MSFSSIDTEVINSCCEYDYHSNNPCDYQNNLLSKTTTNIKGENEMSNVNNEVNEMSLIERTELALEQHKEALVLINKLEALKTELNNVEEQLENRLNRIETINVEEVEAQIEITTERLTKTKEVLSRLDKINVIDKAEQIRLEQEKDMNAYVASLEKTIDKCPNAKDKKDFIMYFGLNKYFNGNGEKLMSGDYEARIKTINNKETTLEGKHKWFKALSTIHSHMFDETCLNHLDELIKDTNIDS